VTKEPRKIKKNIDSRVAMKPTNLPNEMAVGKGGENDGSRGKGDDATISILFAPKTPQNIYPVIFITEPY